MTSRLERVIDRPAVRVLDQASSDAHQTGVTDAGATLTGLSVSFTVTDHPVLVRLFLPWVGAVDAGALVAAYIMEGASVRSVSGWTAPIAGAVGVVLVEELVEEPGEYTRTAAIGRVGGTGTVSNNAGVPTTVSRLSAIEQQ